MKKELLNKYKNNRCLNHHKTLVRLQFNLELAGKINLIPVQAFNLRIMRVNNSKKLK